MMRHSACLAALWLAAAPAEAYAPTSSDAPEPQLVPLTAETVAADPVAAKARCRWFLTSLFDRYQVLTARPGTGEDPSALGALEWARDAYLTLERPTPAVRAAMEADGEVDRLYTDAFGPAVPSGLPDHPLYENDKPLCSDLLGVAAQ